MVDGKTYFFYDEAARKALGENPAGSISKADANWVKLKDKDKE